MDGKKPALLVGLGMPEENEKPGHMLDDSEGPEEDVGEMTDAQVSAAQLVANSLGLKSVDAKKLASALKLFQDSCMTYED